MSVYRKAWILVLLSLLTGCVFSGCQERAPADASPAASSGAALTPAPVRTPYPEDAAEGDDTFYVPQLSANWSDAHQIVGEDTSEFLSDFCLIQDAQDRWHAIGIGGNVGDGKSFFHAVSPANELISHYPYVGRVYSDGQESLQNTGHMWAPYAIYHPNGDAYLYYHHYNERRGSVEMRVLRSTDASLDDWVRLDHPDLRDGNIAFARGSCRDACIFWDEGEQCYFMYYASNGIQLTTSTDLIHWTGSVAVLDAVPDGFVEPESPFVIKRFGYYYLIVSGHDYGRMAVYASKDPRNFGNGKETVLGELNGHAAEIVTVDGRDYIACAAIVPNITGVPYAGLSMENPMLSGVYLQELQWVSLEAAEWMTLDASYGKNNA